VEDGINPDTVTIAEEFKLVAVLPRIKSWFAAIDTVKADVTEQ
jgi:hypothetical protein